MKENPRIVVTGLGPICAAGKGREDVWRSIESGKVPAARHSPRVSGISWGEFPMYLLPEGVNSSPAFPGSSDLPGDPELSLALQAARLAVEDASLEPGALGAASLVLTYEAPGIDRLLQGIFDDFVRLREGKGLEAPPDTHGEASLLESIYQRHKDAVYHTHSFLHLHLAARALGIHGPTLFLNNACASGLYALEALADQLRAGRAIRGIAASAEVPLFPTKHLWFREAKVYSPTGALRPFDRDRDGLVLGVAGAALVLETLESARSRGARIYVEYLGGASSQEGWKVAVPNLTENWCEETIRAALRAAGVAPEEIDLLNPHGAGTQLGDLAEARGIAAVFGPWAERPLVTALKPCFGHTLGASGLLETAALLLAMERGRVPATPGFRTPDPKLGVRCVEKAADLPIRTALKMSSGFAGFTAGAVFRRA